MYLERNDPLGWAHPLVRDWFINKFDSPTEPQIQGWPSILAGQTTLISAPTGSGKTFAAFLACIERLIRKALLGELKHQTEVLYVSPLKALSNDIQKNLAKPLTEITKLAEERGLVMQEIRVAVRTGDTLSRERQAMLRKPPHILVTTPESLYLLLTAEKSRAIMCDIKTVIVDEIHALADDKRGAHLALSLERLDAITNSAPVRIGLSATQKPIELVAAFLTGNHRPPPVLINIGHAKNLELAIEVPRSQLGAVLSNVMWDEIYDRLAELVKQNRSTLVFVNTRRLAERIAHHLAQRLGEEQVAAHHGSLSRKLRLVAETKLKNGELKVLVATASLELGIDIGTVDLVCQIGSPRSIAVLLQRVGRAGHWRGAISKGRIFATTRDELIECAALIKAIKEGDLDQLIIPTQPIDILAQQIVATCATGDWQVDDLFKLVTQAFPYAHLDRTTFNNVLTMLSEGIAGSRGRYGAYLFHDRVNDIVKARRGSRLTAITNGGAIPENGLFTVIVEPDDVKVGTLDEDFAVESNRGDIILLGTTSWQIKRVESRSGRVIVEDAHGAPPSVPFWRGEAPARTSELSLQVAYLRQKISDFCLPHPNPLPQKSTEEEEELINRISKQRATAITFLQDHCGLNNFGAEQLVEYILQGRAVLGAVPTQNTVIAERFFDESGGMQLIIHAPFGARINKAWGLALRKRFCRSFNFELQAAATDDGLNISLTEQHSFPLADVFHFLHPNSIKEVLIQAVLQSPLFTTRWRWDATRALALLRFRNGKKIPPNIQRMLADDLLAAVFPDAAACQDNLAGRDIELPDQPLINETMKDALTEALDMDGLIAVLNRIMSEEIQCLAVDTATPSPFSHEILNANPYAFLDDAPLEERRARAVAMRPILSESVLQEVGQLDSLVIQEVQQQAWPDIRNSDELHDFLQTCIAFPEAINLNEQQKALPIWQDYFAELVANDRAGQAVVNDKTFWFAAEKVKTFLSIYKTAILQHRIVDIEQANPEYFDAIVMLIRGWMLHCGPITSRELSRALALNIADVDQALLKLETTGLILRGHFRYNNNHELEWCERRLLARIHRLTLAKLRKEIEPISATQFMRWLLSLHHLTPGTQLNGEQGLLEIIRQLQGFEIPANAWESQIFARRINHYDPQALDHLCLSGTIGWGRLSPHRAILAESESENNFVMNKKVSAHSSLYSSEKQSDLSQGRTKNRRKSGAYMRVCEHFEEIFRSRLAKDDCFHLGAELVHKKRVLPTSIAPITFFIRDELTIMSEQKQLHQNADLTVLSQVAKGIYQFLKQKGASFFNDIVRGVGNLKSEVENGLWELVAAGMITADGFDNLRSLIDPHRRLGKRGRRNLPRYSMGRWSLLHNEEIFDHVPQIEVFCWMLLKRYGVVFRDLLAREKNIPRWRELLLAFRRLEDRGEIRGGRFISGFLGEQFALPYVVESLRAIRKKEPTGEIITLSAADPLNLVGIILPGQRVTAISGKTIKLRDGVLLDGNG